MDFFLPQDLVDEGDGSVSFIMPFTDFTDPAIPRDVERYRDYRTRSMDFVRARNDRIDRWVGGQ